MSKARRQPGWFATLRRDRGLFTALAVLLLFVGALQPLSAANAARFAGLDILCNPLNAADKPQQSRGEPECPLCPTGHLCAMSVAMDARADATMPVVDRPGVRLPSPARGHAVAASSAGAPPSIRGPPPSM
nr:hypothetical protein [Nitratireductor luteus]